MKEEQKEIDIDQVVGYLTRTFERVTRGMGKAIRYYDVETKQRCSTDLYNLQVDFCYIIDEIQRGPKCLVQKAISDANTLIETAASFARPTTV